MSTIEATAHAVREATGLIGECAVPGNSDLSILTLALTAKADGASEVRRLSKCPVVASMVQILEQMGVSIAQAETGATITGGALRALEEPIDVGDSSMMLGCLAGLVAGREFRTKLAGGVSAEGVLEALRKLGARVDTPVEDPFPITLGGRDLSGAEHEIADTDTVLKSAFFLAGLDASGEVHLVQPSVGDDDIEVLFQASGVVFEKTKEVGQDGYHLVLTGPQAVQPALHDLPGDHNAALYLLGTAAMLRKSELTLHYVGNDWKTRRMLELLRRFSATLDIQVARSESKFAIRTIRAAGSNLRRTRIAGAQTELFLNEIPFLAVLGAVASGETVIRDAATLREGEVDRLALIADNLRRMGVKVGEMPDGVVVQGGPRLQGSELAAGGDAQVALALALAGLAAEGETQIENVGSMQEDYEALFACLSTVVNEKR